MANRRTYLDPMKGWLVFVAPSGDGCDEVIILCWLWLIMAHLSISTNV